MLDYLFHDFDTLGVWSSCVELAGFFISRIQNILMHIWVKITSQNVSTCTNVLLNGKTALKAFLGVPSNRSTTDSSSLHYPQESKVRKIFCWWYWIQCIVTIVKSCGVKFIWCSSVDAWISNILKYSVSLCGLRINLIACRSV